MMVIFNSIEYFGHFGFLIVGLQKEDKTERKKRNMEGGWGNNHLQGILTM